MFHSVYILHRVFYKSNISIMKEFRSKFKIILCFCNEESAKNRFRLAGWNLDFRGNFLTSTNFHYVPCRFSNALNRARKALLELSLTYKPAVWFESLVQSRRNRAQAQLAGSSVHVSFVIKLSDISDSSISSRFKTTYNYIIITLLFLDQEFYTYET